VLYDNTRYKGRESTYQKVAKRYFWDGYYKDIKNFVLQYDRCQFRSNLRQEEALHLIWTSALWSKVDLDIVHIPEYRSKKYLVLARYNLNGWVEERALKIADLESIAIFI
jgi:hypothetical protein